MKQHIKHKYYSIGFGLLAIAAILFTLRPITSRAAMYFGGMYVASLTCTCSGNTLIYINNYGKGPLALTYDGSARLYPNSNIFGTYLLGSYTPGGGQCLMTAAPVCTTIPSDGRFDSSPGTGTS